jgi:hypothetical protein
MSAIAGPHPGKDRKTRPVFGTRALLAVVLGTAAAVILFFALRRFLPSAWSMPGSPELYLTGVLGAVLALTPFAYFVAKRSGYSENPPAWFIAHAVAGCIGVGLLIVHSGLYIRRPPALLLAGGLFLIVQGAWARIYLSHRIAGTFGGKFRAFLSPDPPDKALLAQIIDAKRTLLATLDADKSEATFRPTLAHWLAHPLLAWRYARLARAEMALIGQRRAVSPAQAYWRALHMAVAALFLLGLAIHVVTVTFFAGYVADGGPIHWWHLADWGGPDQ